MLSRESMLNLAGRIITREIHVPELASGAEDDTIIVRALTPREWELQQDRNARAKKSDGKANAMLVARCVVDSNGQRVFSDGDADQIAELPLAGITKITEAILELSGLTEDSEAEIEGNSASRESGSTSSDSPSV